jgi:hypothetical protein
MCEPGRRYGRAVASTLGAIIAIVGLVSSFWVGLIVVLLGLVAFAGFARGRWY